MKNSVKRITNPKIRLKSHFETWIKVYWIMRTDIKLLATRPPPADTNDPEINIFDKKKLSYDITQGVQKCPGELFFISLLFL